MFCPAEFAGSLECSSSAADVAAAVVVVASSWKSAFDDVKLTSDAGVIRGNLTASVYV